jgi:predicted anti-sigma-YlaC factor YlaD
MDKLLDTDITRRGQRLVQEATERALDLAPTSVDQAHELADRLHDGYRSHVPTLQKEVGKRAKRLERQLEKKARQVPLDTPLDQRRRRRTRRRGMTGTMVVIALASVAYVIWRLRRVQGTQEMDRLGPEPGRPAGEPASPNSDLARPQTEGDLAAPHRGS